ncbi:MAG: hypothetical protein U5K54_19350 [Cytophagales bacterium]|nr:hypothetical protein [Cytophagales bacterium]
MAEGAADISGTFIITYYYPIDNASYTVVVSNGCGSVTSNAALLTLGSASVCTSGISRIEVWFWYWLSALGGVNGEYRWYTLPTGGVAISGQVNDTFTTPIFSSSTNYYVALNNGRMRKYTHDYHCYN